MQRFLIPDSVVQRYRPLDATNFGAANTGTLFEKAFRNTTKQPWIELITVDFDSVILDANGIEIPKGTATATYFSNRHARGSFSAPVTGGPVGMPCDPGNFKVQRIEGAGYNDPIFAAQIAGARGAGALKGPKRGKHRRYTKALPGKPRAQVLASMHLAVFYNRGEALHFGNLNEASKGCVHIDDWVKLVQLNYHSVVGRTRVKVSYSGAAQTQFAP